MLIFSFDFDGCLFNDAYIEMVGALECGLIKIEKISNEENWKKSLSKLNSNYYLLTKNQLLYWDSQVKELIPLNFIDGKKPLSLFNELKVNELKVNELKATQRHAVTLKDLKIIDSYTQNVRSSKFAIEMGEEERLALKLKFLFLANQAFFDFIKESYHPDLSSRVLVGSNRQSLAADLANDLGGKGSCFPAIAKIAEHLGVTHDPFLLADAYGELEAGTAYQEAMAYYVRRANGLSPEHPMDVVDAHSDWEFDETKFSLIWTQMQRVANHYPEEEINFHFFDDRGFNHRNNGPDILEILNTLFLDKPWLIPPNVKLHLHHYMGKETKTFAAIKGQGTLDPEYQKTLAEMSERCWENSLPNSANLTLNFAQHLTEEDFQELFLPNTKNDAAEDNDPYLSAAKLYRQDSGFLLFNSLSLASPSPQRTPIKDDIGGDLEPRTPSRKSC